MAEDMTDVILAATRAAEADGSLPVADDVEDDEDDDGAVADDDAVVADDDDAAEDVKPKVEDTTVKPAVVDDKKPKVSAEDQKLLDRLKELGIDAKLLGGSGNRIPHREVLRILRNGFVKMDEGFGKKQAERDEETGRFKKRAADADAWDKLAAEDPDETVRALHRLAPEKYRRFVDLLGAKEAVKEDPKHPDLPDEKDDPEPQLDHKFEDGSMGFKAETAKKHQEWMVRQAERRAYTRLKKELDERVGPAEKKAAAEKRLDDELKEIRKGIAEAKEHWGDLYDKHEGAIVKAKKAADEAGKPISILAAATKVLKAVVQADRDTMRKELLKEQEDAAAAGSVAARGGNKQKVKSSGPESTLDIVKQACGIA